MSEQEKKLWTHADSDHLAERLSRLLSESLEKEFPSGLSEQQFKRLRRDLVKALEEETLIEGRRVVRHFLEEEERRQKQLEKKRKKKVLVEESVERLTLNQRMQHMLLFSCTILLIITGLPIKFHDAHIAEFIIRCLGGPAVTRLIHRIAAVGLTLVGVYHLWYCLAFEEGRKNFGLLIPTKKDARDILQQIGYYLGFKKERPMFGRFSYVEKFDYWAVYWGMVVMIGSGYILWFMEEAINQFGKVSYDIAREAHSDEGLLATLAIIIWHFYNVHFNPKKFPGSLTWWHGRIGIEEFREEHPLEYEEWLLAQKEEEENGAATATGAAPSEAPPPKTPLEGGTES